MYREALAVGILTLLCGPALADPRQVEGWLVGWSPDNSYFVLRWNDEWQSTNYQEQEKDDDQYKLCPSSSGGASGTAAPSWPKSVGRPKLKEPCVSIARKEFQKLKLRLVPPATKPPAGLKAESEESSVTVQVGSWRIVQPTEGSPGDALWRPDGKAVAFSVNACTGTGEWCWPEFLSIDFGWSLAGQAPPPGSPCRARPQASFHVRETATLEASGPELPRGTQVEVLAVTKLTRGATRLYQVRAKPKKSPVKVGYAFLNPDELTRGICPD